MTDFNLPTAKVFTGSSNLSPSGEKGNGDNLVMIEDPRVAASFAINALRIFDHLHFRSVMKSAGVKAAAEHEKPRRRALERCRSRNRKRSAASPPGSRKRTRRADRRNAIERFFLIESKEGSHGSQTHAAKRSERQFGVLVGTVKDGQYDPAGRSPHYEIWVKAGGDYRVAVNVESVDGSDVFRLFRSQLHEADQARSACTRGGHPGFTPLETGRMERASITFAIVSFLLIGCRRFLPRGRG